MPRLAPRGGGLAVVAAAAAVLTAAPAALAAGSPSDLLDVVRVGTGASALTNAATPLSIVPLLGSGGTGTPIALPTAAKSAASPNWPIGVSGTAGSEGALVRSVDGNYLTLAGYGAVPGTTNAGKSINGTSGTTVPRVVARIDAAGNVDTSTALTDAFSQSNVRGAVTTDGTKFWVTGDGGSATATAAKNAPVVYATLGATTSTGLTTTPNQARVPGIAGGNLFFSSSKAPIGLNRLGASGLPTTSGQTATQIATTGDPYGFAFVSRSGGAPDTLYVADGTTGGIFKYVLGGGAWTAAGSTGGVPLAGLAAVPDADGVTLYATTADGLGVVAYRDTAARGAAISSGSFTTIASAPANTLYRGIAVAPTGQVGPPPPTPTPSVTLASSSLGAAIGDADNPTLGVTLDGNGTPASGLTVSATSSNQSVVPDSAITVTGTGVSRTIALAPTGVGTATITVTAKTADGTAGTASFRYGASAAAPDATSRYLYGAANASTVNDVGDGYLLVADDESATLRLYRGDRSGLPVRTWNFQAQTGVTGELDLEWSVRSGNTILWGGSQSNDKSGNVRASASTVFATTVSGSGASTDLAYGGTATGLRNDLLAWDHANGDALGLTGAAAQGSDPKVDTGYNIEGAEYGRDGTTVLLGYRAPIAGGDALVVPVTNLGDLVAGSAAHATFGDPIHWDLGGLGIREIRKNDLNQYLILAGGSGSGGVQQLYTWDGVASHAPVLANRTLPQVTGPGTGGWESIGKLPVPLGDGAAIPLVQDNGDTIFYGGTATGKDVAEGLQKDWVDDVALSLPVPTISFDTTAPDPGLSGDEYAPRAHSSAGRPVVFSVDRSDPGACTVSAAGSGSQTVSFTASSGDCVIDASSAGSFQYAAAARATQVVHLAPPPDTTAPQITIAAPTDGTAYDRGATLTADFSCADGDGGSGVAACTATLDGAPVLPGGALDTDALGEHVFTVDASDEAGNEATQTVRFTVEDVTAPTVTITTPADGAAYPQGATVHAAFTCEDEDGGSGLTSCTGDVANGAPIDTTTLGAHDFTVSATDAAGNAHRETVNYTVVDVTAPQVTITSPNDDATYPQGTPVAATFSCADEDGGSGLTGCDATLDGSPITAGEALDTATLSDHELTVTATDRAGNTTTKTAVYTVADVAAPVVTITSPADGAEFAQGQPATAIYRCDDEDGGSGIRSCAGTDANGSPLDTASLGGKSLVVTATDNAGNVTTKTVSYRVVDRVPPTITLRAPKAQNVARGSVVKADYACADDGGSGIESCTGTVASGAAVDTGTLGRKTFTVTARDAAGNTTTQTVTYTVVDATAPAVTSTVPLEGASYAQGTTVTTSYACKDEPNGSGIKSCAGPVNSGRPLGMTVLGGHDFKIVATDNAGNVTTKVVHYTVVDKTAPSIVITRPTGKYAYGSSVTASYACYDNTGGSGVASCTGTVANGATLNTKVTRGAPQTFTVTAKDRAGNSVTKSVTWSTS